MSNHPSERPASVFVVLACAILAVSSAAVLVRAIDGVNPVVIAFWRMAGSALVLLPALRRFAPRDGGRMLLSGALLAVHFATWFASLEHIAVMRSTLLVTLAPIWAGLIELGILGRPPTSRFWWGLLLATPGVLLMSWDGLFGGSLVGDGLALVGGMAGACYFIIGANVRQRLGVGTYACVVCTVAALSLLPVVLWMGAPMVGFDGRIWILMLGLVLGPQLIGHNGLNYVLRYLPASVVTATTLVEPVGAGILAAAFLGEVPQLVEVAGGAFILTGVFLAIRPGEVVPVDGVADSL